PGAAGRRADADVGDLLRQLQLVLIPLTPPPASRASAAARALARRGVLLLLAVFAAGCAGGARGPTGPVRSPTGIVYEPGTPPTRSRFSQTAALLLSQGVMDRALAIAQEGVVADSANPIHHFLAGLAQ